MDRRLSRIEITLIALAIIGLLVSVYMTIYKITSNDNMCIGSKDCSVVNASRYSELYGIPVAVFGILGYAAILAVLLFERNPGFFSQNGTMLLFTLYLIFLEIAVIKAYCPFCIASQATMTVIFFLSVIRVVRQP
jgi:uncharacterized membrane protein